MCVCREKNHQFCTHTRKKITSFLSALAVDVVVVGISIKFLLHQTKKRTLDFQQQQKEEEKNQMLRCTHLNAQFGFYLFADEIKAVKKMMNINPIWKRHRQHICALCVLFSHCLRNILAIVCTNVCETIRLSFEVEKNTCKHLAIRPSLLSSVCASLSNID